VDNSKVSLSTSFNVDRIGAKSANMVTIVAIKQQLNHRGGHLQPLRLKERLFGRPFL